MGLNETLTLRVSAEGWPGGEPDFSPLEGDFEILDRSVSTRMSIVNGKTSQTREWTVVLAPRREGELSIPPISAGGSANQSLAGPGPARGAGPIPTVVPEPLRLETLVDLAEPYVQQAFTYRVRVLFREQPRRMSLTEPVAEGATIEPAGDDQSYSEMIDGRRYTVIERSFLVVPQRSGPLTIRSPRLEAVVPEDRPGVRRSPLAELEEMFGGRVFQGFPGLADTAPGRRVVERGADQQVEVRPQPDGVGPVWLPAESVQLSDEWAPSPPVFRVGEPVTRILTITASGTTAASLPDMDPGNPDGANLYPEQPRVEDLPGPGGPAAVKSLKIAVVPSRAGDLTLPEIRLPWWDVVQDRARVAVIPQRTVQVEPAVPMAAQSPAPAADPAPVSRADRAEPDGLEAETEAPAVGDPTAALSGLGAGLDGDDQGQPLGLARGPARQRLAPDPGLDPDRPAPPAGRRAATTGARAAGGPAAIPRRRRRGPAPSLSDRRPARGTRCPARLGPGPLAGGRPARTRCPRGPTGRARDGRGPRRDRSGHLCPRPRQTGLWLGRKRHVAAPRAAPRARRPIRTRRPGPRAAGALSARGVRASENQPLRVTNTVTGT